MTLTEFLIARIAEDEYATSLTYETCFVGKIEGCGSRYDLALRMNPARVLAECEAKRRIVEHLSPAVDYDRDRFIVMSTLERAATATLRDLAAIYADHDDYDESWRP